MLFEAAVHAPFVQILCFVSQTTGSLAKTPQHWLGRCDMELNKDSDKKPADVWRLM